MFIRVSIFSLKEGGWPSLNARTRTFALVERGSYWPKIREEVDEYVRTCLVCQQDKTERAKPAGLLEPLPIPIKSLVPFHQGERLHGFYFGIAKSGRNGIYPGGGISFFEVRYLHPSTEKLYRGGSFSYVKNVFFEVLGNTAVNREQSGWTIYGFFTEVFRLLGSKLNFSTSLHPQHRWAD